MPARISQETLTTLQNTALAWDTPLSGEQLEQIRLYLEDVLNYNLKTNITAENNPALLILRHVADGLAAVHPLKELLQGSLEPNILDLGSGAGFIGIAIKIAWPQARVTLMERSERKFRFLNLAAANLGLTGLRVTKAASPGQTFDAVVERALAPLPQALKLALPLTVKNGIIMAYQSQSPDTKAPEFSKILHVDTIKYRLPQEAQERHLMIFKRCIY